MRFAFFWCEGAACHAFYPAQHHHQRDQHGGLYRRDGCRTFGTIIVSYGPRSVSVPLAPSTCDKSHTFYGVSFFDANDAVIVGDAGLSFHFLDSNSFMCYGSWSSVVRVDMAPSGAEVTNLSSQTSPIQVYPNPTNSHFTTIEDDIEHLGGTTIALWNVMGERVQTLFEGNLDGGHHTQQVKIDSGLHGAFFVRLQTGTVVKSVPTTVE